MDDSEKKIFSKFFSLFLIGEYTFRHIAKYNNKYEKILECVGYVKTLSRNAFKELYPDKQYSDILDDAILVLHAYLNSEHFSTLPADCFLYPYYRLMESAPIGPLELKSVHGTICRIPDCKNILDLLVKISINYGVYITHLDHFRNKDYAFNDFSLETIFEKSEPIFPSFKNMSSINDEKSSKSFVKLLTATEITQLVNDRFFVDQVSFFVDLLNPEFNIDTALKLIKNYLIVFSGYTTNSFLNLIQLNNPLFDEFIKLHLDVTLQKIIESDFRNKLVGISMWDCVNLDGMSKPDAVRKFRPKIPKSEIHGKNKKYAKENKNKCPKCGNCDILVNCNVNNECQCDYIDECERTAKRLYDVANKSIMSGKIITTKAKD